MHAGTRTPAVAAGNDARYAVGGILNILVNDVVNEPRLDHPTVPPIWVTDQSVVRSKAAARSSRRRIKY